jgi:hypothetical protein
VRAVALDVEPPVAFTIARTADEMRDVAAWLLAAADAAERPQAVTKG